VQSPEKLNGLVTLSVHAALPVLPVLELFPVLPPLELPPFEEPLPELLVSLEPEPEHPAMASAATRRTSRRIEAS